MLTKLQVGLSRFGLDYQRKNISHLATLSRPALGAKVMLFNGISRLLPHGYSNEGGLLIAYFHILPRAKKQRSCVPIDVNVIPAVILI